MKVKLIAHCVNYNMSLEDIKLQISLHLQENTAHFLNGISVFSSLYTMIFIDILIFFSMLIYMFGAF